MNERNGFYNKAGNLESTKKLEATKRIYDEEIYDENLVQNVPDDYIMEEHMMEQRMLEEHMMEEHMMQHHMLKKGKKLIVKLREIIVLVICIAVLVIVAAVFIKVKGYNTNNNSVIGGISKIAEKVTPGLSEEQLLKRRVKTEKIEEKFNPKELKAYPNEIFTEETIVRMLPGEDRSINVNLNNKGAAKVFVKSKSKDIVITKNATLDISEDEHQNQFVRFDFKVADNVKPKTKGIIELSAEGLPTETMQVIVEEPLKDNKNIEMCYDMVPGMTFSSDFILSIVTNQEEQYLEHTHKIKNFSKNVMIEKNGEIRAWNVGDAVVTLNYKGKDYKIYVRVREEEKQREHNKEVTSIHFVNPITEELEVGDEYSLIAVTLPFMHTEANGNYFDKMAYYESSNPEVCSVTYGDVRAEGPGKCTITAYDRDRKVSTSIEVKVKKKKEKKYNKVLKITPDKAREYGLSNTDGKATVDGLRKIVAGAKSQGKNKVYFTEALELVMEPYGEEWRLIMLNSETMYDFNGMSIKILDHHASPEWGYHLFVMEGVHDTVVKNLNITGNKPEGGCSVSFPDAVDCTIEGCDLGYNYWNIATYSAYYDEGKMNDIKAEVFEFGNIRSDGTEGDSKCRVRSDYIDISHIDPDEDFMVGKYNEFGNYSTCPSIIYDIAYYDADKKFIKKESCHGQFFAYYKPENAKYCRLVFHTDELPINGTTETETRGLYTGFCLKIGHVKRGYKCLIKNNRLHNATHVNLVFCGEQRCIVEGNYFYMDGDVGCDIDWEDFFQAKSCDIVRDNVFTTRYDSFACVSGIGYVFRNNAFYHQAYINITGGTRLFRMFGNVLRNIPSRMENSTDSIFNNNIRGNPFYTFRHERGAEYNGVNPGLRVENNTLYYY